MNKTIEVAGKALDRLRMAVGVLKGNVNPVIAGSIGVGEESRGKLHAGDYETMVKYYRSWVYSAVNVIGRSVARIPLRMYKARKVKGVPKLSRRIKEVMKESSVADKGNLIKFWVDKGYEVEEVEEHPFLKLIKAVNPMMNGFELWETTSIYLDIIGNCYWYLRPNGVGLPGEIWVLQGQYVKVVPDPESLVAGYLYQPKQKIVKLEYNEVIQFKYPCLDNLYYGMSPMQAGAYSIDSDRYQKEFEIDLFKNGALPGTVLESDKTISETAYKRLETFWKRYRRGGKGETAILGNGLKAKKIGLDPQELSFTEGRKATREEILCIYGVPLTMLGFGELTNRATSESLEYAFNKATIQPKLIRIQEKINERIMPLYDEGIFVQFDNPIPKDKEFELKEREANLKNYVTSINEERQKMGEDTADWGERPYMPINLQQVGSGGSVEDNKAVESRDSVYFKMWITKEVNIERHFQKVLKKYFNEERKEVLSNLERLLGKKDITEYILFDMSEENIKLSKVSRPEMAMAIKEGAELAIEEAGLTISVDLIAERNELWMKARLEKYAEGVNKETAGKLAKTLRDGLDQGEGVLDLSKRVDAYYDSTEKYRSLRIARTETAEAMEEGIMQAYREGGIDKVRWLAEPGCCDDCSALDGEIVGIGDSFGNDAFDNATQHPPLHPNCYHKETEVYTEKGWRLFKDVKIGDNCLAINPETLNLEYIKVKNLVNHLQDKMISFKSHNFDLCVTPEHEILYRKDWDRKIGREELNFIKAKDILPNSGKIYRVSKWQAEKPDKIFVNGLEFPAELFCKFMGYYLSEGSVTRTEKKAGGSRNQISISQKDTTKIYEDIRELPFNVFKGKTHITIHNKALAEYLEPFGKSYQKSIPKEIKELNAELIEVFLEAFRYGDGSTRKTKKWKGGNFKDELSYFTSSKQMADDLGELIIKIGHHPSYSLRKDKGKEVKFKNGTYKINHDMWIIRECRSKYAPIKNLDIQEIDYNDRAYCVELEKYHTLLVRFNGKVCWSGNCRCTIVAEMD